MNKAVKFEDLVPEEATIYLYDEKGLKREYLLNRITLKDRSWMEKKLGAKALEQGDMEAYAKLIFRLLKQKEDFEAKEVEEHNDDGQKITSLKKGYERVMEGIIGDNHVKEIVSAILKVMGLSEPVVSEQELEQAKKKETPQKK